MEGLFRLHCEVVSVFPSCDFPREPVQVGYNFPDIEEGFQTPESDYPKLPAFRFPSVT